MRDAGILLACRVVEGMVHLRHVLVRDEQHHQLGARVQVLDDL